MRTNSLGIYVKKIYKHYYGLTYIRVHTYREREKERRGEKRKNFKATPENGVNLIMGLRF